MRVTKHSSNNPSSILHFIDLKGNNHVFAQGLFVSDRAKRNGTLARKNECDISKQVAVEPGAVACFFSLPLSDNHNKRVACGKAISKNSAHKNAFSRRYVINDPGH
ncbi:hypothetical protein D3C75_333770 [compost metagenome]|jgi:hypothetical protein